MDNAFYWSSFIRHLSIPKKQWFLKKFMFKAEEVKKINMDLISEDNYFGPYDTMIHNQKRFSLTRIMPALIYGIYVLVD